MKVAVKDELTIPQQTRYLVGIELGRVERHVSLQTEHDMFVDSRYNVNQIGIRPELRSCIDRIRS
jgi:hypothetical protein